jgi:hypothetical protein
MKTFAQKAIAHREPVKVSKLISIQRGTFYDVSGSLRRAARAVDAGSWGSVTDALLILRYIENSRLYVKGFHYGTGSVEIAQSMCQRVLVRMMNYDN